VDDARADRFSDASLRAMTYEGSLWGLPLAVKSLALFYNTDLVATPPATTDELIALKRDDRYALAYANIDLYGHAPWLHGFGGRVLDDDGNLAIATPEAAAAMDFVADLAQRKIVPKDAQNSDVASMFNAGVAATVMLGPWAIPDISADLHWKVAPLPIISATGKPAAPYLGAEGIVMSARAHDKDAAFAVMDALTSDAAAIVRAREARQVVANVHAYDDPEVARDPVLRAFRTQLQHTVAMPNNPTMRMVWTPYRTALGEVIAGRSDAPTQLRKVQDEVQGYVDRR
ncbi:MAG: extracellular solute-binding protein, partial [Acidobacteriota bacterium]